MKIIYGFILVCFSPLLFVIGCLIFVADGCPVIFRQKRIGNNELPFEMYKFRTMVVDSETQKAKLRKRNEADGPVFKMHNDPRFTPIGRFLAHTGLDELPQLYNVFRGDMALVGPRPLPIDEAVKLAPWMRKRHAILPGIISPAIVSGRYHEDFASWMKSDIEYVQKKSFWYDVRLVFRTFGFLASLFIREIRNS